MNHLQCWYCHKRVTNDLPDGIFFRAIVICPECIEESPENKMHPAGEFHKSFYDENRVKILQYDNLREHFQKMVTDIFGPNYYNMGMDVYTCDRECCEDITRKTKRKGYLRNFFK